MWPISTELSKTGLGNVKLDNGKPHGCCCVGCCAVGWLKVPVRIPDVKPLKSKSLVLPSLPSLKSLWAQIMLLPSDSILAAVIKAFLMLGEERVGRAFLISQMLSILMACFLQGYVGPLLLQLLEAAITLLIQEKPHPADSHGTDDSTLLSKVMGLVQCLLLKPGLLVGTPASTHDSLQASLYRWAVFVPDAGRAAADMTLKVS